MILHDQSLPNFSTKPETLWNDSSPQPRDPPNCRGEGQWRRKSHGGGRLAPKSDKGGSEPNWALLLQQTERFAETEIHGQCWREVSEGVLPSGYDASSIAAEAIAEFLREQGTESLALTPQELRRRLKKCARKIINRLHHRMENEVMVSECDLYPIIKDYGEVISALETFPGPDLNAAETLMDKEQADEFEHLKRQFTASLDRDKLLKDLFGCLCAGIIKREAIARKLGLPVHAIKNAQARLDRHIAQSVFSQFNRRRNLKKVSCQTSQIDLSPPIYNRE